MITWYSPIRARTRNRQARRSLLRLATVLATGSLLFTSIMFAEGAAANASDRDQASAETIEQWYEAGRDAQEQGQVGNAVAFFNEVLRNKPTHSGARRALQSIRKTGADIRYRDGALLAAQITLAAATDPVGSAKAKMESGDYAEAQSILQQALGRDLDDKTKREVNGLLDRLAKIRQDSAARRGELLGGQNVDEIARMLEQAEILLVGQEIDEAERILRDAERLSPGNQRVDELLRQTALLRAGVARQAEELEAATETARRAELQLRARDVYLEAQRRYQEKDVIGAVEAWNRALEIDPDHTQSKQMLEATKELHADAVAREAADREALAQDAELEKKLDTEIPEYSTVDDKDVNEVLKLLRTLSGLDFVKSGNVEGKVWFSVRDRTVREVLDLLAMNYGYTWERVGNIVRVSADLKTVVYPLSEPQYQTLQTVLRDTTLLEDSSMDLRKLLYGENMEALTEGKALYLSEQTRSLTVTDTEEKHEVVRAFLADLPDLTEKYVPTETKYYRLRPDEAREIRDLVEMLLYGEVGAYDPSSRRKLFFDQNTSTLVVIDTPENIAQVEALLADEEIRRSVQEGDLRARQFVVSDPEDAELDPDSIARRKAYIDGVRDILEIMLYGAKGREEAVQKGRRIAVNVDRGTIDVVDTPDNLQKVAEYLSSVRGDSLQDVYIRMFKIKHVSVTDIVDALAFLFYDSTTSARNLFLDYQNIQTISAGDTQGIDADVSGTFEQGSRELYNLQGSGGGQDFLQFFSLRFYPDINSNSLIVYAFEQESIDIVDRVISSFDRPHRMVDIENRIVEVGLDDLTSIGFDYSIANPLQGDFEFDSGLSDLSMLGPENPSRSVNFSYDTLSESQLSFMLTLIDSLSTSETLSAPRILAAPNPYQPAFIFIGRQEPFIDNVQFDDGGDDDPTNNRLVYTFDRTLVGIQLGFIPFILNDNHVFLEIMPNFTDIVGRVPVQQDTGGGGAGEFDPASVSALGEPILGQQAISAAVRIKNGETVVIGGLIKDQVAEDRNDVPLLSRIPFVGAMFSDVSYQVSKTSTLIFVTVNIVEPETY